MKTAPTSERARAGDSVLLASSGHVSTSPDRRGQIVDVLGDPGHESYLVRWLDGRLSVFCLQRQSGSLQRDERRELNSAVDF